MERGTEEGSETDRGRGREREGERRRAGETKSKRDLEMERHRERGGREIRREWGVREGRGRVALQGVSVGMMGSE